MSKKPKIKLSKVFKTIVLPRWKILSVGFFLIVISSLSGLVIPHATRVLLDEVLPKGDIDRLKMVVGAVVGSVLVRSVASFLLTQLLSVEAQHLISVLRVQVQQKVVQLPLRFFDNNKSGALVSRI